MKSKGQITITDLYKHNVHSITFNLFKDALGAKIYKSQKDGHDVQLKLNLGHNETRLLNMSKNELRELIDNLEFLYQALELKLNSEKGSKKLEKE